MATKDQPKPDELELSLFGPGFGECAVVHLGAGKWMVVDSCIDSAADVPVALRYLKDLGVDIAAQVVLVVVTHWHDDHIKGAASVLQAATSARFACSAALKNEEFLVLLRTAEKEIKLVDHTSGASEFASILQILRAQRGREGPNFWAAEGMILHQDLALGVKVSALSPSAATVTSASTAFANLLPKAKQPIRRVPESSPNQLSVVLQIPSPEVSVLLGGDLETGTNTHRGWHAVVASAVRSQVKSIGFKVAHHGSENGDFQGIWTDLLHDSAYALVTPYGRGRKPLPSDKDVRRLLRNTSELFSTVWPPTIKPRGGDKTANRTMDEVAKNRRTIRSVPGHLRLRVPLNTASHPSIGLFDGAIRVTSPQ